MGEGKGRIDRDRDDSVDDSDRAWAENIGSLFLVIRYIWDIYAVYRGYILCIWDGMRCAQGGRQFECSCCRIPATCHLATLPWLLSAISSAVYYAWPGRNSDIALATLAK